MNLDGCWDNLNLPQNDEQSNLDKDIIEEENGTKTFRVKNYIPKRSANKFLEPPYIIFIAIIFILTIITIILASIKTKSTVWICPNETTTEEVIIHDEWPEIILLDKNRFFIYDPPKNSLKLLLEVKNPVQSFDIGAKNTLFWVEAVSSNIMSFRQSGNATEKDINLIFDETRLKPYAIALDPINNNLYIVDESIDGVIIINVDAKYFTLMPLDISRPRYIALDSDKGLMFIASTEKIARAYMDGSAFIRIVVDKAISAIALDPKRENIFWINNNDVIEGSDYLGLYEEKVLVDSVSILDFTILDGYLFWLRKSSEDQNATLWSCKVSNGTYDDHKMLSNAVGTSTLLRANGRFQQNPRQQETSNRQKCQHLTLASSSHTSCACNMSSQLVFNSKCEPITQFLLYTLNSITRSRTLDSGQRIPSEPLWPTPYRVANLSFKTEIDFDYDLENGDFYFSDDKRIYKIKLAGKSPQQEIVLVSTGDMYIEDLAYDWLTGNMYYSQRSKLSTGKHLLAVFNVKKGSHYQKILKYFDFDHSFGMEAAAYGLAVYPSRGTLYFTAGENGLRYIYQTTMNGTEITKFTNIRYVHEYRLIAVDYDKNRVYWISSEISVSHAKFDGSDRKDIMSTTVQKAKTISINKQWMYLTDFDSIWRVNKENGNDYTRIASRYLDNSPKIAGARIINQPQVVGNPCRKNNGACEQFCFYGSNATCDCTDGLKVTPKGVCK